jgi:pyruvate dehydrogenase E1 component alpha subunit
MEEQDLLLPAYRDTGAQILRGVTLVELLQYWGGDERGMDFAAQRQDFPICIPIATQTTHAVGVATAFKLRRQPRVAVTMAGDGATSKGDFYEAINLAGVWMLPVVFVINNNQWAISVPRAHQSATETLAQKAIAAGIPGEQVDGNDVIALRDAMTRALARARSGAGSTLIEALTYRLADHTTADDASRYRDPAEVRTKWHGEPVARLRAYLHAKDIWGPEREQALQHECAAEVDAAVERFLALPAADPRTMFDHLYATLPTALYPQRNAIASRGEDG